MISSELGCVTPWIIAPGSYTPAELKNLAKSIVTSKKFDAGCNCLCAQAIVLPEGWDQKHQFRSILKAEFESAPTDPLYYPGSSRRCAGMVDHYKKLGADRVYETTSHFSAEGGGGNPNKACAKMHPALVECGVLGQDGYDGLALMQEAFGPILGLVEIPGDTENAEEYLLQAAIPFVNDKDRIFGSLSCSLIVPDGLAQSESALRKAIAPLLYGTVAVNCWSVFGYSAMCNGAVWRGHAREPLRQSGNGFIGNHFEIPHAEKTVVYGTPLSRAPLIDKKKPPPAVVLDAMSEFALAKTPV